MTMKPFATGLFLSLLASGWAWADGARIEASLQRPSVGLRQEAVLDVTISGYGEVSEPQFPRLPQFDLTLSQQSQNTEIVNGVLTSSLNLQYVLTPKQLGSFRIGPITAEVDGQTVSSQPLQLQVVESPDSAPLPQSAAQGPAFVSAEVDNKTPYVGQAVTYKLRFCHRPGVSLASQPRLPQTTGFISKPVQAEKSYTTADGYEVNEVTFTLIPTAPGKLEVGSTRVSCHIPFSSQGMQDESDLFHLLQGAGEQELVTEPIALQVQSTPAEGRPADFTGGIGRFTLQAELDSPSGKVGQPVGVELSVRGPEGLELVGAPTLPDLPGFRVLGVAPVKGAESAGMRKFTATLVPTQAGRLEIPAISMSSFDPESRRYQSTATTPLSLEVAAAAAPVSQAEPGLRPQHGDASPRSVDLLNTPIFWGLQAIPLLLLGAAWLATRPPRGLNGEATFSPSCRPLFRRSLANRWRL